MNLAYSCLKQCTIFIGLIDEHLEKLQLKLINKDFKKGQQIYTPADTQKDLYIIRKGLIKIYTIKNGKESVLELLKVGDVFGGFFNVNSDNLAVYAEALEESNVCKLQYQVFLNILEEYPSLATSIIQDLSQRLTTAQERITNITTGNAEETIFNELKRMAKLFGSKTPQGYELHMKLSHQQIADFVGLTRESVSHSLKRLSDDNRIIKENSRLVVFE